MVLRKDAFSVDQIYSDGSPETIDIGYQDDTVWGSKTFWNQLSRRFLWCRWIWGAFKIMRSPIFNLDVESCCCSWKEKGSRLLSVASSGGQRSRQVCPESFLLCFYIKLLQEFTVCSSSLNRKVAASFAVFSHSWPRKNLGNSLKKGDIPSSDHERFERLLKEGVVKMIVFLD